MMVNEVLAGPGRGWIILWAARGGGGGDGHVGHGSSIIDFDSSSIDWVVWSDSAIQLENSFPPQDERAHLEYTSENKE